MANWAALAGGNTPAVDLQNAALNAFNALNAVPAVNLGGLGNINLLRPILEHVETIETAYLDAEQAYKSEDWAAAHAALTRMNVAATALQGNGTVGAGNTAVAATACRTALNNAITNDASDTATSCFTARNAGLQQATATNFANDVLLTARATLAALATPAATLEAAKAERAHDKIAAAVGRAPVAQGIFNAQVAGNATLGQLATTADTITHELGQVLDEAKALLALPGLAGQAAQQAALQGTVDYLDKLVHGGDGDRMTQSRTLSQAELVNAARALTNPAPGTYPKAMVAEMLEARVAIHNPANKYYLQPEQLMQVVEPLLVSGTDANLGASATPVVHRLLHHRSRACCTSCSRCSSPPRRRRGGQWAGTARAQCCSCSRICGWSRTCRRPWRRCSRRWRPARRWRAPCRRASPRRPRRLAPRRPWRKPPRPNPKPRAASAEFVARAAPAPPLRRRRLHVDARLG